MWHGAVRTPWAVLRWLPKGGCPNDVLSPSKSLSSYPQVELLGATCASTAWFAPPPPITGSMGHGVVHLLELAFYMVVPTRSLVHCVGPTVHSWFACLITQCSNPSCCGPPPPPLLVPLVIPTLFPASPLSRRPQNAECVALFPVPLPKPGYYAASPRDLLACVPPAACPGVDPDAVREAYQRLLDAGGDGIDQLLRLFNATGVSLVRAAVARGSANNASTPQCRSPRGAMTVHNPMLLTHGACQGV